MDHPDPRPDALPGALLGYDFKHLDGTDYILGDNYSVRETLDSINSDGIKLRNMLPGPWLWIKLLGTEESKNGGDFNRFKIIHIADIKAYKAKLAAKAAEKAAKK